MTASVFTLDRFRLAGRGHLHGARCILQNDPPSSGPVPALASASASYLVHVALECALKARILEKGGCDSVEELTKKHPKVYGPLFTTKQGHDLDKLAKDLGVDRLLATLGKGWREDECWKRLSSSNRPYSLRYGTEDLDDAAVAEDVERCAELLEVLLSGLRRMRRDRRPEKK
jgi:hypothetical protein